MYYVLKVECSPTLNQKELTKFCKDRDILLVAYSPIGGRYDAANKSPTFAFDDKVQSIADKYNKTTIQIVLRYLVNIFFNKVDI